MEETGSEKVKEWLEATVKLMVDVPGEVKVMEGLSPDGSTSYFTIYVNYDHDLGKVVGKGGSNINSLRKLASAIALARYDRRCDITAYDHTKSRSRRTSTE